MPTILTRPARRWLARRVLGLVRRVPKLHVWLARVAWRIAPPKTPERTQSTRALVATVTAWRTVDQRADDAQAIAGTDDLPRVLRLTAGMIEAERRERRRAGEIQP